MSIATRVRSLLCFAAVAALAGAAGCAGGGSGTQIPTTLPASNNTGGSAANPAAHASGVAWQLQAGGARQDGALQALAFLPPAITIDEGDTVTWTVAGEVHTITFLGNNVAPP